MKRIFLFLTLFCAGLYVSAQNSYQLSRLDSLFHLLENENKLMGSISIQKAGLEIYNKQFGFCDVATQLKPTTTSVYRIGSISKMFTAVMILQLVDENKLSLEAKLSDFYPSVPHSDHITIDQMLGHRSGIHSITDDSVYLGYLSTYQSHEQLLQRIDASESEFEPGTKTAYSNSNYILLGYILEKVTGFDYQINLETRITRPLSLHYTRYGSAITPENGNCYSYKYENKEIIKEVETDMSIPGGAGAIISTPTELNHFIKALFDGKLLSANSLNKMTDLKEHFGYGIFAMPFYDHNGFGHTGGIDGFRSSLSWFPDDSLAIAICVNAADYNPNEALIGALSILLNKEYKLPVFNVVTVDEALLTTYTGVYSSPDFPLKMNITLKEKQLFGMASGQSAFPLTAVNETTFRFDQAGIVINFGINTLTIKQGGMNIQMKKE
jgi:CubicO group peptidase (beta-lactamase class C family)